MRSPFNGSSLLPGGIFKSSSTAAALMTIHQSGSRRRCAAAGATVVDIHYPRWVLAAKEEAYNIVRQAEFPPQIKVYLATIGPQYPKSIEEMIDRAEKFNGPRPDGAGPNPSPWVMISQQRSNGPGPRSGLLALRV